MKNLRYIGITLLAVGILFCSSIASQSEPSKNISTVLVSLDFTEALAKVLTADTSITVIRAIPADQSPETHTHYIKRNYHSFAAKAQNADAVLSILGAWPEDPLYPWARRANIRVIPIDIIQPMDRSRAGVPLLSNPSGEKGGLMHVWNSPGNCARMADIAAFDLTQLFPHEEATIIENLAEFKQELFRLRTQYEMKFGMLDTFEVVALTTDYLYLTDEFGIGVVDFFLKPELRWQQDDIRALAEKVISNNVEAVLCKWQPKDEIAAALMKNGTRIIIPQPFKLRGDTPAAAQLLNFYEYNLEALLNGLSSP